MIKIDWFKVFLNVSIRKMSVENQENITIIDPDRKAKLKAWYQENKERLKEKYLAKNYDSKGLPRPPPRVAKDKKPKKVVRKLTPEEAKEVMLAVAVLKRIQPDLMSKLPGL